MSYPKRYHKVCEYCGKEYQTGSPKQKYCGSKCQHIVQSIERRGISRGISKDKTYHICKQCGERFPHKGNTANIFHSRECAFQWKRDNPVKGWPSCRVHIGQCEICGIWFVRHGKKLTRSLCGNRDCELAYGRKWDKETNLLRHRKLHKRFRCKECGAWIEPEYGSKRREYCSDRCLKQYCGRIAKATRRAKKHMGIYETIDPIQVFQRDKWHCQLCGIRTPRNKRGTIETIAPELDHIIPLSQNGTHTWFNVQCTCRKCNQAKGATIQGQLGLAM